MAQPTRPPASPSRLSQPQRHRNRKPDLISEGTITTACATMPRVVPTPRISSSAVGRRPDDVPVTNPPKNRTAATPMTTTLFSTGAQALAAKRSLVFRMAPKSAAMP